jgi:hypothetical protein
MAGLSLEWKNMERNVITVKKARGKITLEELLEFFHEPKQINCFDGKIVMFMFRVNGDADLYPYGWEEQKGDMQDLLILEDEGSCPICGQKMFVQYCPECGKKLY